MNNLPIDPGVGSEARMDEPDFASPQNVHVLLLMALTVVGIYGCYRLAVPFLPALVWSVTLTVLIIPMQRLLEARVRPSFAAAVSIALVAVIVVVPAVVLGQQMMGEAVRGTELLGANAISEKWRAIVTANPWFASLVDRFGARLNLPAVVDAAVGWITTTAGTLVRGGVVQLTGVLMTFYFLFYFLRDRTLLLESVRALSPLSRTQMNRLFDAVADTIHATVYGTVVIALIQGTLGGLMFWWLGLPAPILWGIVMGMLAIIPVLGAFLIWIPAAIFLLLDGSPGKALILMLWGAIVVGGIDNVLYPILVGNRMKMHSMVAFGAIVGGLVVFGAAGLILGPIVVTVTAWLLAIWRRRNVVLEQQVHETGLG
jgi:predicted PurR-regulated permease PerM